MPKPPPKSGVPCPKRSWLTIITPFATRTLCECQPSGIGTVASRGLAAGNEQTVGRFRLVVVFDPPARRHGEGIEIFPVEALAADDAVAEAAAFERRDEQARGLPLRTGVLARPQHLREERHGFEQGAAVHRVDVFDAERIVRIAVPVAVLLEQLAQRLPAIAVHRRGASRTPVM